MKVELSRRNRLAAGACILLAGLTLLELAAAQSAKGKSGATSGAYSSPASQARQQQAYSAQPAKPASNTSGSGTKRRPTPVQQQTQPQQQSYANQDSSESTEDPLSDSEPALYGSVAGAPGVDFPAYTRIPKTSFTCEGKGFDFGYYADEEAQCQVYHVCWSGRRESFLCGVGTVFNQAILACDYWHSVDCSKSSQFYGVNSELGKAGAEPAAGSQRVQPASTGSIDSPRRNGARVQQQQQQQQQQQTIYGSSSDDSSPPEPVQAPVQQQISYSSPPTRPLSPSPSVGSTKGGSSSYGSYSPVRQSNNFDYQPQPASKTSQSAGQQQRLAVAAPIQQAPLPVTTLATPAAKRPRFNMDFNQKVNSLIDSPVRPPLKSPSANNNQKLAGQLKGRQQTASNFAQSAVSRAHQTGSQSLNPGSSRKSSVQRPVEQQVQQQQVVPTSAYELADLEEPQSREQPQQQQQQASYDDGPVQTSTVQSAGYGRASPVTTPINQHHQQPQQHLNQNQAQPHQHQITVHAGGSGDGSSAITTQFDTLTPVGNRDQQQQQQQQQVQQDQASYDSADDSGASSSDDFRSAGAKAAASHNQNWYIMRSI